MSTTLRRETKETQVTVGLGEAVHVTTGLPFFDHMLGTLARYAGLPLRIEARGDLRHHLMEDVAITTGEYLRRQTPETAARYGERTLPMDDALVQAVVDLGGRAFFAGKLPSKLYTHWFRSFATHAALTLHLRVLRGGDRHHVLEAAFKATGLALREALRDDGAVFSTKGSVRWVETP
jgi:imidazoleglycerol-phosphate dehydratase